jgi:ABC transport system ATP-binding/permease protein
MSVTLAPPLPRIGRAATPSRRPRGYSARPDARRPAPGDLHVSGLTLDVAGGRRLVDDLSFTASRGTVTAVIGPSGAGKSTLSRLLAGVTEPSAGAVRFNGLDMRRDRHAMKTRVGLVPQDDVIHRRLTVRSGLRFAASLRLSGAMGWRERRHRIQGVTRQLGLEEHGDVRVDRLSGGQRKRASVAMELLTEPSLLILDEPTSGLDPALDRQVMQTLRTLADAGRTVLVVTHSVAYLDVCDQVLVLAPGGMAAYVGPPAGVKPHFGTDDWGDIFDSVAVDPLGSRERWLATAASASSPASARSRRSGAPARAGWMMQFATLVARQLALMVSDRGYLAMLVVLPFLIGLLPLVVPGHAGLTTVPRNDPSDAGEPTSILSLLIIGATFMGISMSIRDLVGERGIYLRERAVGLFPSAYLLAKLLVFGVLSIASTAAMVWVASLVKAAPTTEVMGIGSPLFELFLPLALTTWVSAACGLAISAFVPTSDQVMPVLMVVLLMQLVLHGGLIPILDNHVLNLVSYVAPGRWGFAAAASGIHLEALTAPGQPVGVHVDQDPLWDPQRLRWLVDMAVLAAFGAVFATTAWMRLRATKHR